MLNRCPSCQASVLDDDAEVCPFCGSPMDAGKAKGFTPTAKPAAERPDVPVKPPSPVAAPASTPTPRKPAASRPEPPTDDDPFTVDRKAGSGAIALAPKRTPQRPHKVVCPMCDTPGYVPEAASGKEVRCANPKCLVPVFKAPDFAAPKPAEPEPSGGVSPTLLTFGAVAVILLGGAAFWWFGLREPPGRQSVTPETADSGSAGAPEPETPTDATTPPSDQEPPPPSPEEVLAAALARLPALADDITEPQRQPLRRRYAAESLAVAGKVEAAQEQIDRLAETRSADPFYQIPPLAELAWARLRSGEAQAKSAFDRSAPLASQIPRQGFDPARVAIQWAAAAARFGTREAALDMARTPRDDPAGERLLAMLAAAALFNGGDLDAEHRLRPVRSWAVPKAMAVSFDLLDRGQADAAKAWAESQDDSTARAEGLAAWAEAATVGEMDAAIASADPAERAYVHARAAVRLAGSPAGRDAAGSLLDRVKEVAAGFPAPEPVRVPDLAAAYRAEAPDGAAAILRGSVLSEAAHAAALLGRSDEAAALTAQALDRFQASAPSSPALTERRREFDGLGISGVQSELKTALGLTSDDQARQAANEYRRKLQELETAATRRLNAGTELLVRAVEWNLGSAVLAEATKRHSAEDIHARDPYLAGDAGGRLLAAFQAAGDAAAVKAIRSAGVGDRDVPPAEALELASATALGSEKPAAVGRDLFSQRWARVDRGERLAVAVRAACRLVTQGKAAEALALGAAIPDEAAREEVLRYLSVCAAAAGAGGEIRQGLPNLRLGPTEEASILRGLIEGAVAARNAPNTPVASTTAVPETP